jgi:hypothetical protein
MLRKSTLIAAVAASLFIPTIAFAGHVGGAGGGGGGGRGGGMHVGGANTNGGGSRGAMQVGGGGRGDRVHVGDGGGRRFVGGGGRHFWHGRWYSYGVGPCWSLGPDGYIWVCG